MVQVNLHHPFLAMQFQPKPTHCTRCGPKHPVEVMQEAKEVAEEEDLLPEDVDAVLGVLEEEAEEEAVLGLPPSLWLSSKSNVAQLSMAIPPLEDPMTTTTKTALGARSGLPSVLDKLTLTTTETLEKEPEMMMPVKMKRCWRQRRSEGRLGTVFKPRAIRKTSPH